MNVLTCDVLRLAIFPFEAARAQPLTAPQFGNLKRTDFDQWLKLR